jgi:hypothetical protein
MPLPVIPTNHHRNKNDRFPGVITTRVPFVNRSVQFAEIRDLGSGVCGHGMTRKVTELGMDDHGWCAGVNHEIHESHEMGGGVYWPRNDTEDHGIGEGTIGWLARGGFTTKDTEGTKRTGGNRGG